MAKGQGGRPLERKCLSSSDFKEKIILKFVDISLSNRKKPEKWKKIVGVTSPLPITMSTIPSWMKYIFVPTHPSLIITSPASFH